jgi:ketosteroid isomerase-like protein
MKIFFLSICSFLILQTTNAQSKDSIAVANAVTELKNAMIDANVAVLERLASDGLSYGHSGGKIENKAAFINAFASNTSDFVKIDLTEQTIQIIGNAAVVRHKLFATTNDGGKPGEVKLSVMLVWLKQKKQWQLIGRQAVKLL